MEIIDLDALKYLEDHLLTIICFAKVKNPFSPVAPYLAVLCFQERPEDLTVHQSFPAVIQSDCLSSCVIGKQCVYMHGIFCFWNVLGFFCLKHGNKIAKDGKNRAFMSGSRGPLNSFALGRDLRALLKIV